MKYLRMYVGLMALLLIFIDSRAQTSKNKLIRPVRLDKAALSGLGLKQIKLNHEPDRKFFQRSLYRGEDLSIFIVSSQSWTTRMDNFSIDEYVYIYHGKSRARPDGGEDLYFQTGEHFAIPKGFTGQWEVMAADHMHYELSVISTKRAPEVRKSKGQLPALFDKDLLSGVDVDWGTGNRYEKKLFEGDELIISLQTEKPGKREIKTPAEEQMISLMSGHIKIRDVEGNMHTFYSGDIFVLPKGFTGSWESLGHSLVKFLRIRKAG